MATVAETQTADGVLAAVAESITAKSWSATEWSGERRNVWAWVIEHSPHDEPLFAAGKNQAKHPTEILRAEIAQRLRGTFVCKRRECGGNDAIAVINHNARCVKDWREAKAWVEKA